MQKQHDRRKPKVLIIGWAGEIDRDYSGIGVEKNRHTDSVFHLWC